MSRFIPYLADEAIERDAVALLAEYAHARSVVIAPPIPVEDIVEKHLKLRFEFDDTHKLFGVTRGSEQDADILGAIFFDERRIVIDESLDPEERRGIEGRYRFTLAHEGGGHWRLHRHLLAKDPAQAGLFGGLPAPSVICRSSQAKERVEWQADFYASCLLMPRNLVIEAWRQRFGNTNARVVRRKNRITLPGYVNDEIAAALCSFEQQHDDEVLKEFVRPFADKFLVSMVAMRIRLEKIGLIHLADGLLIPPSTLLAIRARLPAGATPRQSKSLCRSRSLGRRARWMQKASGCCRFG
jgi:Zn-dependent peptidase ImmA (M78 family)